MRNLTLLTDLYQLTMMYGYYKSDMMDVRAVFDMFYRQQNPRMNFAIFAGLEQLIDYINNLHFDEENIAYLRSLNLFDEGYLNVLRNFHFNGDIQAVPEGTVVFPDEPLIRVTGSIFEAQLVETALLNIINHQTLIATKASRVREAAESDNVLEFGLRRAQGPDAGIYGARAAVIGGANATSNVLAGQMFGVPVRGTHAHSWVMSFPTELDSFRAYAKQFPSTCMLLVDTYDTLKSGIPNAITVFKELSEQGYRPAGVRLDSGDLAYLSRESRKMLDDAGFPDAQICASGDLDEVIIRDLKLQGARIDIWGVGTKLITSLDCPALGGVYKLSAEIIGTQVHPKIKISENPAKLTNPGLKKLLRIYSDYDNMALADLIALEHEDIDETKPLTIFHPIDTWKQKTLVDFHIKNLHVPIFKGGLQVYETPALMDIQAHAKQDLSTFWDQYKRVLNPHDYKVDLSDQLWMLKQSMLKNSPKVPPMQL